MGSLPCCPRGQGCSPRACLCRERAGCSAGRYLAPPCPCSLPHSRASPLPGAGGVPGLCAPPQPSPFLGQQFPAGRCSPPCPCRGMQGGMERHGEGRCSPHSAFVGSQVKADICISVSVYFETLSPGQSKGLAEMTNINLVPVPTAASRIKPTAAKAAFPPFLCPNHSRL